MKKIVLTTVCALAVSGAAFAQGTVSWSGFAGNFLAQTNSATYSPITTFGALAGTSTGGGGVANTPASTTGLFYYELLYTTYTGSQIANPTTLTSLFTWSDTGLTATNANFANGRILPTVANTGASVPWANGVTNSIMLVGWSANLGTSWGSVSNMLKNWASDQIANAFFGESVTGYINPATGNPGVTLFAAGATSQGLPINNIASPAQLYLLPVVPEPATMVLAGLGGLSLLLFRRQRK